MSLPLLKTFLNPTRRNIYHILFSIKITYVCQASLAAISCTVVQQFTGFKLTERRAVPLRQWASCWFFWPHPIFERNEAGHLKISCTDW